MCGDAAGMIHPLCGNGMSMAIQSAQIASKLILNYLEGKISTRKALENEYLSQWNRQFKWRLKAGHFILGFGLPIISFFLPKHYKLIFIVAVPILLSAQFIIGERANFLKFCFIVLLFLIFYKHFSFKKKLSKD